MIKSKWSLLIGGTILLAACGAEEEKSTNLPEPTAVEQPAAVEAAPEETRVDTVAAPTNVEAAAKAAQEQALATQAAQAAAQAAKPAHQSPLEAGQAYLLANGKRKGVMTRPSGLQIEVLKKGNGPIPKSSDKVSTHYHGMLVNGQVFDSSVDRGVPASFPVLGVIKGWIEALQLMKVGSKWRLSIPPDLGYGSGGAPGGKIPPNSTLIFDLELLSID